MVPISFNICSPEGKILIIGQSIIFIFLIAIDSAPEKHIFPDASASIALIP